MKYVFNEMNFVERIAFAVASKLMLIAEWQYSVKAFIYLDNDQLMLK